MEFFLIYETRYEDDDIEIHSQLYKTFEDALLTVQAEGAIRNEIDQEEHPEIETERANEPDGVYVGERSVNDRNGRIIKTIFFHIKRVTFN